MGFVQKLKVPKWVCRSTLASFCNDQPFFAIFGPARGQILEKRPKKYLKIDGFLLFFGVAAVMMCKGASMGIQDWKVA